MAITLRDEQARWLRTRAQRLDPRSQNPRDTVASIVHDVGGLQAQEPAAATLGVRVRSARLVATDVDRARSDGRSVVRTWCMRGTLHLVAAEDLGWLLALLGPLFMRASRRRRVELGLDDESCTRGVHALQDLLADRGPLTRAEIVEQLAPQGIRLIGQAAPHLLAYAALAGVICLGPDRGRDFTYVLLEDWVRPSPVRSREAALGELARRHLAAFGPSGPEDLASWSGLPMGDARAAWGLVANGCVEVSVAGRPAWMRASRIDWIDARPAPTPVVRLLPGFDAYLLGHRSRELVVAPNYAKRVNAGGGIVHPTLLIDGRVEGTWRSRRRRSALDVIVEPFEPLLPEVQTGLEVEIEDLGRFLGQTTTLRVAAPH
jgi:hypothetical protein